MNEIQKAELIFWNALRKYYFFYKKQITSEEWGCFGDLQEKQHAKAHVPHWNEVSISKNDFFLKKTQELLCEMTTASCWKQIERWMETDHTVFTLIK